MKLMDQYSDEEFARIVEESSSYKEVLQNLGYNSSSGFQFNKLKEKIADLSISTEHFTSSKNPRKLSPEIVFKEEGDVTQNVLRRWYKKGEYTPYICSICGQEPMWQGKELTLILDHINGNNKDDRIENLRWVCPNCNMQLDTTNGKNNIGKKPKVINTCARCGQPISKGAVHCKACASLLQEKELPVTREELKELIRTTPFTQIGAKFGVSDNAIRKWCDKYSLPRKATEIKQISDEEWEKI